MTRKWNCGSEWHRWDPHLHAPGTLFNDEYAGDWEGFFQAIEQATPGVEALGITDYCVLDSYIEFCRRRSEGGRAKGVSLVFPNVEFRLTVETEKKKGINLHLLFSPDDPNHQFEIERVLSELQFEYKGRKYRCTRQDLRQLGRSVDPTQSDDRGALRKGAEQFKVSLEQMKNVFRSDDWLRRNCLVAICLNKNDGTSGLQNDSAFTALREELESFAHIIFSSRESDRQYWLGKKEGFPAESIETKYGKLKPCLHGSDAHRLDRVLRPDDDRYCWIRSELTFTGLRQILVEPESRVAIGLQPPLGASKSETITALEVSGARWLGTSLIDLNQGLVAIIGPKGSGKTALADMIAHAAGVEISDDSSFLLKANEYLTSETAKLHWADGTVSDPAPLVNAGQEEDWQCCVRYLSQRFVDRLCSSDGLRDELVAEIENVVFRAIPEEECLGAASFEQLREQRLENVLRMRAQYLAEVQRQSDVIATEDSKIRDLQAAKKLLQDIDKNIKSLERDMKSLLPKEKKEETKLLSIIQAALDARTNAIQTVKLRLQRIDGLGQEYRQLKSDVETQIREIYQRYSDCGLIAEEWATFKPQFNEASDSAMAAAKARQESAVKLLEAPALRMPDDYATWSLAELRARAEALTKDLGIEQQRLQKYRITSTKLTQVKQQYLGQQNVVKDFEGAEPRRKIATAARREAYFKAFDTYVQEEAILDQLYAPLRAQLVSASTEERRLEFCVNRRIDLGLWVERGENLLDLRIAGPFQGRGQLFEIAKTVLLPAWQRGGAEKVAEAMQSFISEYAHALSQHKKKDVSFAQVGEWLFSMDHVTLEYGIRYGGIELSRLSPGSRGIVLLMLYLAIDQWDTRPLLVDQPEENLDPQSIYEQLVPYFRQAKQRRQVILVTHNPNLVVNADADQVIVASAERKAPTELPLIRYASGGIENPDTRSRVCTILEGGERAFLERETRYDLSGTRGAKEKPTALTAT